MTYPHSKLRSLVPVQTLTVGKGPLALIYVTPLVQWAEGGRRGFRPAR